MTYVSRHVIFVSFGSVTSVSALLRHIVTCQTRNVYFKLFICSSYIQPHRAGDTGGKLTVHSAICNYLILHHALQCCISNGTISLKGHNIAEKNES